ncbi:MAG: diguanylate cyclase [gamma proteobacterium symbiont of Taylorina sp.]|nr:diguanylate cyclase [gamma proteobacterium symbiont of Taylorina sp.]
MFNNSQELKPLLLLILLVFNISHIAYAETNHVSLLLPWKHQFQFAGYYAAIEKGYYQQLGLNVTIEEYDLNRDVTLAVSSGQSQFGIGHSSLIFDMLKEYNNIVLLAAIHQSSPLVLLAKKQASITTLADINNKKIMMTNDQFFTASINAMLHSENLKQNSFKVVETTFNPIDLINGYADLMVAYSSNEPYTLTEKGIEYTLFDPKDYGYDFYSDILFTSDNMIKNKPEIVNAFYEASIKGWKYAYAHITEMSRIILNKYNTQGRNLSALLFEAQALKKLAIKDGVPFGHLDPVRLREMANTFRLLDLLKVRNVDFENYIYQPKYEDRRLLTHLQKQYLQGKEKITICVVQNNMPFEGLIKGQMSGIAADILSIIKKNLDINFSYIGVSDKLQAESWLQQKKCDMLALANEYESSDQSFLITQAYAEIPLTLISHEEIPFIYDTKSLLTKVFGALVELQSPQLNALMKIQTIDTIQEGIKQLESKQLYGIITDLLSYKKMQQEKLFDKKYFAHKLEQNRSIHFAFKHDEKILFEIIEKHLSRITPSEKSRILGKWISAEYIESIDYRLMWLMLFIVFVILLTGYWISIRLKKQIAIKTDKINQQLLLFDKYVSASRTDRYGVINYVSEEFCNVSGYSKEELIGKTHSFLRDKSNSDELYQDLWMTINSGHTWKGELKNRNKAGKAIWFETIISPIFNRDKTISGFEAIRHDITLEKVVQNFNIKLEQEVRERTRELNNNQKYLDTLFDVNPSIAFVVRDLHLERVNKAFLNFTCFSSLEYFLEEHHCISDLFEKREGYFKPDNRLSNDVVYSTDTGIDHHKVMMIKDNHEFIFSVNAQQFNIDDSHCYLVILENITEIEKLAMTDKLTAICNRLRLDLALDHQIKQFQRYEQVFSIMIIDIDHFKKVNDNYGHQKGDSVLQQFSQLLLASIRDIDILGRWGGEEFMLICLNTQVEGAIKLAEQIRQKVQSQSFQLDYQLTASIGVAQMESKMTEQELINKADDALYQAKNSGRNKVVQG